MQAASHRIFNAAIAASVIFSYPPITKEKIVVALGLIIFSSFPDWIERFGLKHRGISHSLLMYVLIGAILLSVYPTYPLVGLAGLAVVSGCLGHLIGDSFSKNSITVFGFKAGISLYSTGRASEQVFLYSSVMFLTALTIFLRR